MKIVKKEFNELTVEELYEILRVRNAVFIVEQECPYQDIDGLDQVSTHIMLIDDGALKAYARVFLKRDEDNVAQIGRVITTDRGKGYGNIVLDAAISCAENDYKLKDMYLEAQVYAIGYYKKHGFEVCSEEFLEDGIPHVQMRRG